jgi:hypothetical protein
MPRPRTKFPGAPAITLTAQKKWGRDCRDCQAFVEAWAIWCPTPRQSAGSVGRPKVMLDPQALHQVALFSARWVYHLVETGSDVLEWHLDYNGMGEWLPTVRALRPYLRRNDAASWGELGVISARRWRDEVQYQAVRRLLAHRLGLNQKSLRRRFDERAYWGDQLELGRPG